MFRIERIQNYHAEDPHFMAQFLENEARNGWLFVQIFPLPFNVGYSVIFRVL